MTRRHKPVVVLLTLEGFAALEASAEQHHHDTDLHAHWLLAQRLGFGMDVSPDLTDQPALSLALAKEVAS